MSILRDHHNDQDGLLVEALEHPWDDLQKRCAAWTDFMTAMGFALPSDSAVDQFVEKLQTWQRLRRRYWRKDFATVRSAPLSQKILCGLPVNENFTVSLFMWNTFITKQVGMRARLKRNEIAGHPATHVWREFARKVVGFKGTAGDGSDYLGVDGGEAPREWTLMPLSLNKWSEDDAPFLRDRLGGQWFDLGFHDHGNRLAVDKYMTQCHLYDADEPTDNIYSQVTGDVDPRDILACFELVS